MHLHKTNQFILLGILVLSTPITILAQNETSEVQYPGNVLFRWKTDEMSDKNVCAVVSPWGNKVKVHISSPDIVSIKAVGDNVLVSQNPAPVLRIEKEKPIELYKADTPGFMGVPAEHARAIIEALYSNKRILVRYFTWPGKESVTENVLIGDIAGAYEAGRAVCGWEDLGLEKTLFPITPSMIGDDFATFANTWTVRKTFFDGCELSARTSTFYDGSGSAYGKDHYPFTVKVLDKDGETVAIVEHKKNKRINRKIIKQLLELAERVGPYGFFSVDGQYFDTINRVYGFKEAVRYYETHCDVTFD